MIEPNTRIDGWSVGARVACDASTPDCDVLFPLAVESFEKRDPGHPPIVSTTLHKEGFYPNERNELVRIFRSAVGIWVVVFELADGSQRAIGAGNALGDPMAFWEGPERAP